MIEEYSSIAFLRDIQAEFLRGLAQRIQEIEELWEAVHRGRHRNGELENLHRLVHTLDGESATFGFERVSQVARPLVRTLARLPASGEEPAASAKRAVADGIGELRRAAGGYSPDRLPDLPRIFPNRDAQAPRGEDEKLVFLVDDHEELAKATALQLRHYDYRVMIFTDLAGLAEEIRRHRPTAVVMDIVLPEGRLAGADFIADLRRSHAAVCETPPHVVFVSARTDIEARLHASRAGGSAFFTKPVDVTALAEKLDQLTGKRPEEPYEILIVDDDGDIAALHARHLERAGMTVTIVTDPMAALEQIDAVRPDLVLLDIYMPGCSGPELAAVLRQHETHMSLPIVFLSFEDNLDQQVEALRRGGDEFLTKPIDPEHLVNTVLPRAQRGRLLGSLIHRDGLTGLLNHSEQKEQLRIELRRAAREGTPLVFAILDVDELASVNDRFGHSTGNRVLRSLAGMLKKRLRATDVVARSGGDEFAVTLPHTGLADARRRFDEIVESFAQLGHVACDQRFTVSVSCGLAAYPQYPDDELLSAAAARALLEAKSKGGRRVTAAG